jgi:radical SAM protein (TIGR01212 family)
LTQIEEGITFFAEKYKTQEYLAYFQAFSNTYAEISHLEKLYLEALSHPKVIGLVISTRPDCINMEILGLLTQLAEKYYISLELGIESTYNPTLETINRCHSFEETIAAFEMARASNLHLGGHLILGLPGENREILLSHAKNINTLPIEILKIHHLQIVKHTMMAFQYKNDPGMFHLFELDDYIDLVTDFIALLRPDIILGRFTSESPARYLIAPKWNGLKNYEITAMIDKALINKDLWQGKFFQLPD